MYQLLKQIVVTGIKTEAPPQPDEALRVVARTACARRFSSISPARSPSATWTPVRATAASSRSTRSTIRTTTSKGLGIKFVASPRHADMLLVTGPVSRHMEVALKRTYDATPEPEAGGGDRRLRLHRRHLRRELRELRAGVERDPGGCRGAGLPADAARDHAGDTDGDQRKTLTCPQFFSVCVKNSSVRLNASSRASGCSPTVAPQQLRAC